MTSRNLAETLWHRRGWKGRLALVGALLVLLYAGCMVGISWWNSRGIKKELARIRAAGEPVTADELAAIYRVPDGEKDATQLWLQALDALDRVQNPGTRGSLPFVGTGGEPPPPGEPWAELQKAEDFLKQYSEALRLLHEAAEAGGAARYPADLRLGFQLQLPHLNGLRTAARLLALEAQVRAQQGQTGQAVRAIRDLFAVEKSVESEPILVSQFVRLALDSMAIQRIEKLLGAAHFSDEDLTRLQEDLRKTRYEDGIRQALLGERVFGIMAFEDPSSLGIKTSVGGAWWLRLFSDRQSYLKIMEESVAAAREPWPQAIDRTRAVSRQLQASSGVRQWMTKMLAPVIELVPLAGARATARNRCADLAIAVERYRRKYGRRPERLEQLVPEYVPELPSDPFTGGPLHYRPQADQYVAYSVGEDGVDNGGTGDQSGKPDVVFRVGRKK